MSRNPLLRFVIAAVLVVGLLLPSAALARGPVRNAVSSPGWSSLWSFLLQAIEKAGFLKNGSQIDPDGAPQSDNRGTIDPDGLKNRSQIDPDGTPQSDNHGTIDPDG